MTNPLRPTYGTSPSGRPEAYIRVNDTMVACSLDEYVAWLNAHEKRRGSWVTIREEDRDGKPGKRRVEWLGQTGSDAYLRGLGISPPNDRRSERAQPIDRYIPDYGRP